MSAPQQPDWESHTRAPEAPDQLAALEEALTRSEGDEWIARDEWRWDVDWIVTALVVLLLAAGVLLAGCGGGGDSYPPDQERATIQPVNCGVPGACG